MTTAVRHTKAAPLDAGRWVTPVLVGLAVTLLIVAVVRIGMGVLTVAPAVGLDYGIYHDRATDFLAGRGLYLPRQLAGPYAVEIGDSLYPPPMLLLFVPFLILPAILWWVVPLAICGAVIWRHRPRAWGWVVIGVLALSDGTLLTVVKGNPSLWIAAALAVGTVWRPATVLVLLKPSLAPLALIGVRDRWWWVALAVSLLLSLAFLPLWVDYVRAIRDSDVGLAYSLRELPFLLIPVVAWLSSSCRPRLPRP